eukprot:601369-Amphidinium_carterae.1
MPECVCLLPERQSAAQTMHTRKIREHTHKEYSMPLAPGSLVGAREQKVKRMTCLSETVKWWGMLFDMVAELAIWSAELATWVA